MEDWLKKITQNAEDIYKQINAQKDENGLGFMDKLEQEFNKNRPLRKSNSSTPNYKSLLLKQILI